MISLLKSKSRLLNRRALFISANKLSVFHWVNGDLGSSYLFDSDSAGRENFKRYLSEFDNTPMTILVDLLGEEFRQETIPHVFGSDRKALIERKQSRLFRDASYLYTQNQEREADGRRDDRLLFMALTVEINLLIQNCRLVSYHPQFVDPPDAWLFRLLCYPIFLHPFEYIQ